MRTSTLLLLGLATTASAAVAQVPADSATAVRDTVVVPALQPSTPRAVRIVFPTEGGVFYYRAGAGTGLRRERPSARTDSIGTGAAVPEAGRATGGPTGPGITRRDLDRLEDRLLRALDQRLAALGREPPDQPPSVIAPLAPTERLPDERPPVTAYEPGQADRLPLDPVIVREVERAVLDTGLFTATTVPFEFAKARLLPASRSALDAVADVLLRYPTLRVQVGGHTDAVGSDATNDRLSQARAASVVEALVARGVPRGRLTAVGYGKRRPVASNGTVTGRALNRRVEFRVVAR